MTPNAKLIVSAAAFAVIGARVLRADYTTLYPGLTYDPVNTGTGYKSATINAKSFSVADGIALVTPSYFLGGSNKGTLAESITTTGATALGTLGTTSSGSFAATGEAVNPSGVEVGYSSFYNGSGGSLGVRAVKWVPGSTTAIELQTLGTSANTVAGGISDAGQGNAVAYVVGSDGSAAGFATLYDSSGNAVSDEPVRWDSGGNVTQLGSISIGGTPIGNNVGFSTFGQTYVSAMNSTGTAVGNIAAASSTGFGTRAVSWNSSGGATQLTPLSTSDGTGVTGSTFTYAYAINNAGVTIGTSYKYLSSTTADTRPVSWDASGNLTQLGNLGLTYTSGGFSGRFTGTPYAINSAGVIAGTVSGISSSDARAVRWATNGTATELQSLFYNTTGATTARAYGINDKGLASGSAQSGPSVVGQPTPTHAVVWSSSGIPIDLNYLIDPTANTGWVLTSAYAIDSNNWVSGLGNYTPAGATSSQAYARGFLMQVPNVDIWSAATTTNGDGVTWDAATNTNFNDGTGAVAFHNNDIVSFDTPSSATPTVTISGLVSPAMTLFTNTTSSYTLNGANTSSGITGTGALLKYGAGTVTLNTANSYTGATVINAGTLNLGVAGALPAGTNLTINGSGTSVVAGSVGTAYALQVGSLSLFNGTLDLKNNDLIVHSSTLAAVAALVSKGFNSGGWNGSTGIVSSTAATNPLTALGVVANNDGSGNPLYGASGTIATTFGGASPVAGDVLVKYTYYGDANLDGAVTSADYSRIDSGYLADVSSPGSVTGWFNGDFNYDGQINGSDYTLIDNAFNTQGTAIAAEIAVPGATPTSQIAGAVSVPEPASLGLMSVVALGLCRRRCRR